MSDMGDDVYEKMEKELLAARALIKAQADLIAMMPHRAVPLHSPEGEANKAWREELAAYEEACK